MPIMPAFGSGGLQEQARLKFGQRLMGCFLMGSLQQVLANLCGRAKKKEIIVPKSRKKGFCHTNVQTSHLETTH